MVQYTPINMQVYSWFSKHRLICRFIYGSVNTDYCVGLFRPVYTCYAVEFSGFTASVFTVYVVDFYRVHSILVIYSGFSICMLFCRIFRVYILALFRVLFIQEMLQVYSEFSSYRLFYRFIHFTIHMYRQGYTIASFCKKSNKFEDLWELSNNSKKKIPQLQNDLN